MNPSWSWLIEGMVNLGILLSFSVNNTWSAMPRDNGVFSPNNIRMYHECEDMIEKSVPR